MILHKLNKLKIILFRKNFLKGLFSGIAATTEHIPILNSLGNLNTIVDIGANNGQFTLAARDTYKKTKIISFEPLTKPSKKFKRFFAKDKNIVLYKYAIGSKISQSLIHVSKKNDSSSLLPIGSKQSSIFPGTNESHLEKIQISTLHQLIKKEDLISPVLVKIDVQGYELETLKGCVEYIPKFDIIIVECSFVELYEGQALADEVIKYLNKYSFKFEGIYNMYYDKYGIAIQGDLLFKIRNNNET